MIALDVRKYNKKITLEKCSELYNDVESMLSPIPVKLGVKERVIILPDEIWINKWQAKNIFCDGAGNIWDTWRAVKVRVL